MNDHRIIELLSRKMAGEISEAELVELRQLMAGYPDVAYYEEILKQIWAKPKADRNIADHYEKHLSKYAEEFDVGESKDEGEEFPRRKLSSYSLPVLFVLLLVVVAAIFLYPPGPDGIQAADTQIISGKGIRKNITLPDGTNVWLNSESKLSYDKAMVNSDERVVRLSGEAFFDVKHDKKRPFFIKTDKISIRVLGTSFNVRAYENDLRTETTLIRGSIELSVNNRPAEKIILKPSEKFILNEQSGSAAKHPSADAAKLIIEYVAPVIVADKAYVVETSWKENYLVFKNESMGELIPKLERWFNVKITVKNPKINDFRYTGVFSKETIDQALLAMQLTKHYHFKIKNHDIEIY